MMKLLAAVDFSKITDGILNQAAQLAKALNAKLWILHVASDETQAIVYEVTEYSSLSPEFVGLAGDVQLARDLSAEEIKREHTHLLAISSKLRNEGIDAQAILVKGDAAKLITEKAEDLGVDMIILGSHGHGLLHKVLLGSVSESVIRHARCSITIVPASDG
jgi:nucleotide-binding universal stress UspA family protein